ncbi:hypothetical protein THAOC_10882, partial [Thalassiosira oceanica]
MSRAVSHCFALVILRTGRTGGKSAIGKAITAESTRHDTPQTTNSTNCAGIRVRAARKEDLPDGVSSVFLPAAVAPVALAEASLLRDIATKMGDDREAQKIHHETSPLVGDVGPKGDDAAGDAESQDREATFKDDVLDTLHLAGPIFVSRVSWVGMKSTDTALLGHTSGDALSAAALSDLYTMCTAVLIQGRVLGILVGQTSGADNRHLAVVYLRISVAVLSALAVPVAISWAYTEDVWTWMGQPGDVAGMAGYYSRVFILAIPAQMIYSQLSQYLTAQRVMRPEVVTSSAGLAANLVLGLVLVLGWPIPGFAGLGFAACPIVTVVVVYIQLCILGYYFVKTEHAKPPIEGANVNILSHWTSGFTWTRFQTFSQLYFPAALALSSDFWRMGLVGAIAAKIGEREVGLFNASY